MRYRTPAAWAAMVLRDPLALLSDHAHLEKKAAANALELLNRWPEPATLDGPWVAAMTAIARDEVEHLARVTRLLIRRGGKLSRQHKNPYANALRTLVRLGAGPDEILDRLLISSLIEARSCERFELLACGCEDGEMARLYSGLCLGAAGTTAFSSIWPATSPNPPGPTIAGIGCSMPRPASPPNKPPARACIAG